MKKLTNGGEVMGFEWRTGEPPTKLPAAIQQFHKLIEIADRDCDGCWVYLHYGNCAGERGLHIIHEDTWRECAERFKGIFPCDCHECVS
jgi:hypothetical protein